MGGSLVGGGAYPECCGVGTVRGWHQGRVCAMATAFAIPGWNGGKRRFNVRKQNFRDDHMPARVRVIVKNSLNAPMSTRADLSPRALRRATMLTTRPR
jgi:hypothetical protein